MLLAEDERLAAKSPGDTVEVEVAGKKTEVSTLTLSKTITSKNT